MITIIQDTREKENKKNHILSYLERENVNVVRSKLFVGDYCLIHDMTTVVDIKESIMEIQQNLMNAQKHKAFRDECDRAYKNGIKLYVLIEESGIKDIDDVKNYEIPKYKSNGYKRVKGKTTLNHYKGQPMAKFDPNTLSKTMKTFQERHHCTFLFCDKKDSGRLILFLLTRNKGDKNNVKDR